MDNRVVSEALFIIVVEKDAMFQKMIDEGFFDYFPKSVLVTVGRHLLFEYNPTYWLRFRSFVVQGKGYPDICTRKVLRWLVEQLALPVYGLFDSDPHGIFLVTLYSRN